MSKQASLGRRVFRAVFFGVGGAAASRVFLALAGILLSNALGQETFGRFSNVNDTVNLFVTFSGAGVSATLTRYIAANRQDPQLQGIFIRTLSKACLVMSLALSAALAVFAPQISWLSAGTTELAPYFRLVAVAVFFSAMAAVEQSVMIGFECFAANSLIQLVQGLVYCAAGWSLSRTWGIYGAVAALVLSHGLHCLLSLIHNQLYIRRHRIVLRWQWNAMTRQAMFGFALPSYAAGLFVLPVNWIGNAILTRAAGFSQMAVFSVARQWMTYITYIPSQLGQMRPIYTDLYARGQKRSLTRLLLRTLVTTTGAALVLGALVLLFSDSILGIYGQGYLQGRYTLAFMILAAVLYTAQVQTGFLLQATGKMWIGFAVNVLWAASLLGCYLGLAGLEDLGYAISYCVAYLITLVVQLWVVLGELGRIKETST